MNEHFVFNLVQLFPIVLIGYLLPWMGHTRRGLLFGVTVPLEFAGSAVATAAVRRYRNRALVVATLVLLACVGATALQWGVAIAPAATVVELIAFTVLWQWERRRMLSHAIVVPLERSADLAPGHPAGSLLATIAALLPLAATALWLHRHWALIPDRWPRHWDAAGHVNGWGVRTAASVYFPLFMGAAVVLLFLMILAVMMYAPGAQSRQRARILAPMAALAWAMSLLFCSMAFQPLMHLNGDSTVLGLIGLHMVVILGIVVWLVVRSGFMQAMDKSGKAVEPYDGTPDAHWYGGVFYYNPGDAAVLVAKRYGWGWTLNFARPVAWIFTILIVAFAIFAALLPKLLQ